MLLNDFFNIVNINDSDGVIEATIKINPSHTIFDGHFPDNPITPGVIQIQFIKEILEHKLKRLCVLQSIGRCKFMAILNPNKDSEIVITIKHKIEEEILIISAQGSSQDTSTTFFKFTAKYA
jgi:3-hydroxyacyl-[acyl-carrier-protein] dehydratase